MARQDFSDGGFIGKLGTVVGQRWHNKRYVRTWVKPADARTPDQLSSRDMWREAVIMSQKGMSMTGSWRVFDTSKCGEFAIRCGLSYKEIKAGTYGPDRLPVTDTKGTLVAGSESSVTYDPDGVALSGIIDIGGSYGYALDQIIHVWGWKSNNLQTFQYQRISSSGRYETDFFIRNQPFRAGDLIYVAVVERTRADPVSTIAYMSRRPFTIIPMI